MEVIHFHLVLDGVITPVIRGAIGHSTLDATTSHPHREAIRVVITAIPALCHRGTAKLTTPDHQRVIQHPTSLKVLEQASNWLVDRTRIVFMTTLEVSVLIPAVMPRSRTSQLNKAHTALEEATRHQALCSKNARRSILMVNAIQLFRCFGLTAEVVEVWDSRLHFEGQLIVLDGSLDRTSVARRAQNTLIKLLQEVKFFELLGIRCLSTLQIRNRLSTGLEKRALKGCGQEA